MESRRSIIQSLLDAEKEKYEERILLNPVVVKEDEDDDLILIS